MDNYTRILRSNLDRLYGDLPRDLAENLPAERAGEQFVFRAFGGRCVLSPEGITLDGQSAPPVMGILISLYALHASSHGMVLEPFAAFKAFPDSGPYVGAFATHTQQLLVPQVAGIKGALSRIVETLGGEIGGASDAGDFSFRVHPLPKIALRYIFYEADEEFPASVTCLFSNNANRFLPMDGLADVGEYTSRTLRAMVETETPLEGA